jgi:hypothetical protein
MIERQDQAGYSRKDAENELKNYIKRQVIELKRHVDQVNLLYGKILKPSEDDINSLMQAYQVGRIQFDSLLDSIIMVYDLENQYYDHLGSIYKILYDIEFITGEKYYNL